MEIRERREVGSGREGGCCDEDTESGGEDARAPAAADGSRPDTRQLVPTAMDVRSRRDGDTDGGSRLGGSSDDEDAGPDIWTKRPRPTPAKSTASPAGPPAVDSPSGGRC